VSPAVGETAGVSVTVSSVGAGVFSGITVELFAAGLQLVNKNVATNESETTRNNDVVRINSPFKTPLP